MLWKNERENEMISTMQSKRNKLGPLKNRRDRVDSAPTYSLITLVIFSSMASIVPLPGGRNGMMSKSFS